jgi:hypothetical protein
MAVVSVGSGTLTVRFLGVHRFWTLKRQLDIPLDHVVDARADPLLASASPGWRLLGTHLPGVVTAGRFTSNGERAFWDVINPNKAVVIELRGERYRRLVLEVEEPENVVDGVQCALADGTSKPALVALGRPSASGTRRPSAPLRFPSAITPSVERSPVVSRCAQS